MKSILVVAVLLAGFVFTASGQHEYAPIEPQKLKYKDWTYKNVRTGEEINLRSFTVGKKLTMVVYFAPWCHNWHNEAPFAQKLFEKYKDAGLGVIGVSLYAEEVKVVANLAEKGVTFPVVVESSSTADRQTTPHYEYRQKTLDTRKWGSPWHLFLTPENLRAKGETLTKKPFVVNGELIEEEAEKFIRRQLGLPAEEAKTAQNAENKEIEVCAEETKPDFQKP